MYKVTQSDFKKKRKENQKQSEFFFFGKISGILPSEEEQTAEDSSTRNATRTKRKGNTIPRTSTTGNRVRELGILRPARAAAGADDRLPVPEFDIVTLLIPVVDM